MREKNSGVVFRHTILESNIPCTNGRQDDIEFVKAKVFLPSTAEVGVDTSDPLEEGSRIAVFNDFRMRYASPSAEAVAGSAWRPAYFTTENLFWYWLRTPKGNDEGFTYYAYNGNPYGHKFSCSPRVGIRPVLNIDSDMPVERSVNIEALYQVG